MRPFDVKSNDILQQTAQSLQEGKKMARAIENICSALQPLAIPSVQADLSAVEERAMEIARVFNRLYNSIAKEAFGSENR